jgi:hypothetical protein
MGQTETNTQIKRQGTCGRGDRVRIGCKMVGEDPEMRRTFFAEGVDKLEREPDVTVLYSARCEVWLEIWQLATHVRYLTQ